jgi:hypothetical protein
MSPWRYVSLLSSQYRASELTNVVPRTAAPQPSTTYCRHAARASLAAHAYHTQRKPRRSMLAQVLVEVVPLLLPLLLLSPRLSSR